MQFSMVNVDMDGSLRNPYVAVATLLAVIVFGLWMASILLSQRPPLLKGIRLAGCYLASIVGTVVFQRVGKHILVLQHSTANTQVGFIGKVPLHLGPTCALALGVLLYLTRRMWKQRSATSTP
jgi:hypothetical protein